MVSRKFQDEMSRNRDKFGDKKLDNGKPVPAVLNEFTTPILFPRYLRGLINDSVSNKQYFGIIRKF